MKIEFDVPEYDPKRGLKLQWDEDFLISVETHGPQVHIRANPAGLRSLARHLLCLAQDGIPQGRHFHLDDLNSLEEGSAELIVERS